AGYALAPAWPAFVLSGAVYGLWSGSIDPGINSWMALVGDLRAMNLIHFAYGLGATLGPLLVTGALTFGLGWRAAYVAAIASVGALLPAFALTRRRWGRSSDVATGGHPHAAHRRLPWLLLSVTLATFFVYVGVEVGTGA